VRLFCCGCDSFGNSHAISHPDACHLSSVLHLDSTTRELHDPLVTDESFTEPLLPPGAEQDLNLDENQHKYTDGRAGIRSHELPQDLSSACRPCPGKNEVRRQGDQQVCIGTIFLLPEQGKRTLVCAINTLLYLLHMSARGVCWSRRLP